MLSVCLKRWFVNCCSLFTRLVDNLNWPDESDCQFKKCAVSGSFFSCRFADCDNARDAECLKFELRKCVRWTLRFNGTIPFSMQPWYRKNLLSAWNLNWMIILYFNCSLRLWRAFPCICMLFLYNAFSVSLVCLPAYFQHAFYFDLHVFWISEIQIAWKLNCHFKFT